MLPVPTTIWRRCIRQPHDNVCEWVSGNWTFPQLQVQAPTSLLVSTNCRSCQRTCSRSLKANVGENVKPFSFLFTQCFQFWLSTLRNLHVYIARQSCYFKTNMVLWDQGGFSMRDFFFNPKTVIDIRIKGWVFGRDFLPNCTCLPASQNRNIKPEFCLQASLLFIFHLDVMILCQFSLLGFQIRIEWFSQLGALPLWHQRLIQKLQFPGERAWRNFIMRS